VAGTASQDAVDPAKNPALKAAIRAARKAMIPDTYTNRMLQYAAQGYDSIEFPTYSTRLGFRGLCHGLGQNSNNSVRVTDAFLRAVRDDKPWELIRRTDGKVPRPSARELWDQVGHAAWACADPGIQFHDTVNAWHTCPKTGRSAAVEPLLGIHVPRRHRLQPGVDEPADLLEGRPFDAEGYVHATRLWTLTLEISVMMAQFPSREIAQLSL
jgi:ribonucleoside-diphosphate reductase alpha chain